MAGRNVIDRTDHGFRTAGSIIKQSNGDIFMDIIKHKVDSDREFRRLQIKDGPHYIDFTCESIKLTNKMGSHGKIQRRTQEFFELHRDEIPHVIEFLQSLINNK
jgi:hypothetical protein